MSEADPIPNEPRTRILFVDDEARFAELARLALSGRFEVQATTSPTEALALASDPAVRLVLTDYQMAELDGVELIRRIHGARRDLPCILFSGHLSREEWAAAHNAGCRHVLRKPLALKTILDLCESLLAPPEAPLIPEPSRDLLESIPWRGTLGRNLRSLGAHLLEGHSPLYIKAPEGGFPKELLLGLLPSLQPYPGPDSPPPPLPLYTELDGLDLAAQGRIAQLISSRRDIPWIFSAAATPDELLERGLLSEALYFRLGTAVHLFPPPSDCPDDTLLLCGWWLAGHSPPAALEDEAREWLRPQLGIWDWNTLLLLLRTAAAQQPGRPVDISALQQASLAVSLGSDLGDIERYADFADKFTRQLRVAWDALSRTQK